VAPGDIAMYADMSVFYPGPLKCLPPCVPSSPKFDPQPGQLRRYKLCLTSGRPATVQDSTSFYCLTAHNVAVKVTLIFRVCFWRRPVK